MLASAITRPRLSAALLLDWAERLAVCGLFSTMIAMRLGQFNVPGQREWLMLYCLSEGIVALLILMRRHSSQVTPRVLDWVWAVSATLLPMLANSGSSAPLVSAAWGIGVVLAGVLIQLSAKLVLWRSFGIIAANRGVKVSGPYRFVRHPMYAGYFVANCGLLLLSPTLWNVAIYGLAWTSQILRILAEERLLNEDPAYREYAALARYRVIPGVF